jgi:hypothetical protein
MMLSRNTTSLYPKFQFFGKRFVFQGASEAAPRAPENFNTNEKQSDQDAINEVAPQSPSQIMSSAMSRATVVKTRFQKNTKILADLINTDPLLNPNAPSAGTNSANTPT